MAKYFIGVYTGDVDGAGTSARVYISLIGSNGRTREYQLDNPDRDDFERGHHDRFEIKNVPDNLGDVQAITIRHDNTGSYAAWYLDRVRVQNSNSPGHWTIFRCCRFLEGGKGDTCVGVLIKTNGEQHCISRSPFPIQDPWDLAQDVFGDIGNALTGFGLRSAVLA